MRIVTKPYTLKKDFFIKYCYLSILKQQWYFSVLFLAGFLCGLCFKMTWLSILSVVFEVLFLVFWIVQIYGVTCLPQGKMLFEKYFYEFSEDRILLHIDAMRGAPLKWEQILKIKRYKEGFVFFLSKVQLFYIPKSIFKSEIEYNLFCSFLKKKKLL